MKTSTLIMLTKRLLLDGVRCCNPALCVMLTIATSFHTRIISSHRLKQVNLLANDLFCIPVLLSTYEFFCAEMNLSQSSIYRFFGCLASVCKQNRLTVAKFLVLK